MNNYSIDPSIAFCTKSANSNFNDIFENENVIYRKLINPFSNQLQANCYLAIDNGQTPELGGLSLIDYGTDLERIGIYEHGLVAQGKVIAYSKPNKGSYFHPINETTAITAQLDTNGSNTIKKVSDALMVVLESGLLTYPAYTDLYQLHNSLNTVNREICKGAI
jgi:hypothetical protein